MITPSDGSPAATPDSPGGIAEETGGSSETPRKYPFNGYAPGNYLCRCNDCGVQYIADRRAWRCEPCAEKITLLAVGFSAADNSEHDMRLSTKLANMGKRAKYRNTPVTVDGIRFASKLEAKRYCELILLERAKAIRSLECQPRYVLDIDGEKFGEYRGDFSYWEMTCVGERKVCEDVKSPATKTALWRLKWKLAQALYPNVTFREYP